MVIKNIDIFQKILFKHYRFATGFEIVIMIFNNLL